MSSQTRIVASMLRSVITMLHCTTRRSHGPITRLPLAITVMTCDFQMFHSPIATISRATAVLCYDIRVPNCSIKMVFMPTWVISVLTWDVTTLHEVSWSSRVVSNCPTLHGDIAVLNFDPAIINCANVVPNCGLTMLCCAIMALWGASTMPDLDDKCRTVNLTMLYLIMMPHCAMKMPFVPSYSSLVREREHNLGAPPLQPE